MTDSREQSYYEIALTNRQVMGVFVVLLVCVLAAFLGGVWVGRGETVSVQTVEPEAITSGVAEGEEPLQQMGFFSGTDEQTTDSAAAASSDGGASNSDVAEGEPTQPVIIEEIGDDAEPVPSLVQELSAGRATAEIVATPPESTTSRPPAPTASPPPAASGAVVVQVFSSSDEAHARRVMERVRSGGYPAVLSPIDVDGKAMYRVRVGPYIDRREAQAVADRIRRSYKLDTWITR